MSISISKLLNELNSPFLIKWANKIGLEGIKLEDYYKKSSKQGIDNHILLQEKIKTQGYKDYNLKYIEYNLNGKIFHGRCDLIMEKDGIDYIFDIKSNNNIYLSHKLQLIAYKKIYGNCKIGIINIDTEEETILNISDEEEEFYYNILRGLYLIYTNKSLLNEK